MLKAKAMGCNMSKQKPPARIYLLPLLPALLFAALLAPCMAYADDSRLIVELKEVRDAPGEIRASLYREPDTFRKEEIAFKVISVPARSGDRQLVFDGLPPGRFAVMVYHDENSDGRLNLRFGMFPTEGYGLSNNPKVVGPPNLPTAPSRSPDRRRRLTSGSRIESIARPRVGQGVNGAVHCAGSFLSAK
jgi:uncharacterized protein (DUF2141 family)